MNPKEYPFSLFNKELVDNLVELDRQTKELEAQFKRIDDKAEEIVKLLDGFTADDVGQIIISAVMKLKKCSIVQSQNES